MPAPNGKPFISYKCCGPITAQHVAVAVHSAARSWLFHLSRIVQHEEYVTAATIPPSTPRPSSAPRSPSGPRLDDLLPSLHFWEEFTSVPVEELKTVVRSLMEALRLRSEYMQRIGGGLPNTTKKLINLEEKSNTIQYNLPVAPSERKFALHRQNGIVVLTESDRIVKLEAAPISHEKFLKDYTWLNGIVNDGPLRTCCSQRLKCLKMNFEMHVMLRGDLETIEQQSVPHRDFYNIRKVDTHIHAASSMNAKHLLRFIKKKMPDANDVVQEKIVHGGPSPQERMHGQNRRRIPHLHEKIGQFGTSASWCYIIRHRHRLWEGITMCLPRKPDVVLKENDRNCKLVPSHDTAIPGLVLSDSHYTGQIFKGLHVANGIASDDPLRTRFENAEQRNVPHQDFYNIRKVDTHIHAASSMNDKHLLRFIKKKISTNADNVVHEKNGRKMTMTELMREKTSV
uniref:AMP deaminase n=1 Tax=Globodera rostochiensis TaxID=31243 RepID=A0A914GQH7_GLORO